MKPPDPSRRHVSAYSTREKIARLAWSLVQATAFGLSFPTWYGWRNMLLRMFGANVHRTCRFRRTVRFECPWNFAAGANCSIGERAIIYCLGPVTLAERITISQHAHLCAGSHDYKRADMPLTRPPIVIQSDVWIAADAFVGPNVTIGAGAILGARAVAMRDLKPWTIYAGNPAQPVSPRPPLPDPRNAAGPTNDAPASTTSAV